VIITRETGFSFDKLLNLFQSIKDVFSESCGYDLLNIWIFLQGVSDAEKTELEAKMKTINRAYKVLNETYSRRIYDSGRNFNGESDIEDYFDSDTSR